jgi:thioredoxin reductase (NADPH)
MKTDSIEKVDLLIIGSGPAGMTAALYAARAELQPIVITGTELGGQASLTHTIENFPGFPEGIGGAQLGELFQKQAERFGARFILDNVSEVNLSQRPGMVSTYGSAYLTESLIIAMGASPNHLNIPGEVEFTGKGVSYCATCDGWFFKGKRVVVVGGGDSALEEALFLTRFAESVVIVHRRDELRAGVILQTRARENPKISFIYNCVVTQINGTLGVESVRIRNIQNGKEEDLLTEGMFVFIGHTPNTSLFQGQIDIDEKGYIVTNAQMQTSLPGVFAAGEVCDSQYRQVITSAGMGAAAAIQATRFLENR